MPSSILEVSLVELSVASELRFDRHFSLKQQ